MVNILQNTYDSGARAVRFPGLKCNMLHGFERESRNIMQHFGFCCLAVAGLIGCHSKAAVRALPYDLCRSMNDGYALRTLPGAVDAPALVW